MVKVVFDDCKIVVFESYYYVYYFTELVFTGTTMCTYSSIILTVDQLTHFPKTYLKKYQKRKLFHN